MALLNGSNDERRAGGWRHAREAGHATWHICLVFYSCSPMACPQWHAPMPRSDPKSPHSAHCRARARSQSPNNPQPAQSPSSHIHPFVRHAVCARTTLAWHLSREGSELRRTQAARVYTVKGTDACDLQWPSPPQHAPAASQQGLAFMMRNRASSEISMEFRRSGCQLFLPAAPRCTGLWHTNTSDPSTGARGLSGIHRLVDLWCGGRDPRSARR